MLGTAYFWDPLFLFCIWKYQNTDKIRQVWEECVIFLILSSTLKSDWNKQSGHFRMDWRFSIGLRPLYKSVSDVDSVHKICSLRKKTCSLRSCLGPSRCLRCEHGAHCWTYVYWMYCTVAIGAHWLIFFFF